MKRVHRWAATLAGIGIAALVVVGVLMRLMDGMFEEGQGIRDLEDAGLKRRSIAGPKGLTLSYFQTGDPALGRVVYCHGTPGDANAWSRYLLEPVGYESIGVEKDSDYFNVATDAIPKLAAMEMKSG